MAYGQINQEDFFDFYSELLGRGGLKPKSCGVYSCRRPHPLQKWSYLSHDPLQCGHWNVLGGDLDLFPCLWYGLRWEFPLAPLKEPPLDLLLGGGSTCTSARFFLGKCFFPVLPDLPPRLLMVLDPGSSVLLCFLFVVLALPLPCGSRSLVSESESINSAILF